MRQKFKLSQLILIIGIIIVFGLIIIFFDDKKALSVVLTTFSGCAVIYAIIFEGELKRKIKGKSKLTGIGFFLIIIYIAVSIGNGYNARNTIEENEQQSARDSVSDEQIIANLIEANRKLEDKRRVDSANIVELNARLARLDTTLILNALKELEEQRRTKEEEKENIFLHFKSENTINLKLIYLNYKDSDFDRIMKKDNRSFFVSTGFTYDFAIKYMNISNNSYLVENLNALIQQTNILNEMCNLIRTNEEEKTRLENIENFKKGIAHIHNILYGFLCQFKNCDSYRDFELLNNKFLPMTDEELNKIFDLKLSLENRSYHLQRIVEFKTQETNKK